MQDLFDQLKGTFESFKTQLEAAKADGKLSFSEIVQLFMEGVRALVAAASQLNVTGAEKKKLVTEAAAKFYDTILAPIDLPGIPNFIESTMVDPALRLVFLQGVGGIIEFFVAQLPKDEATA